MQKKLVFSLDQFQADSRSGESDSQRTARVMEEAMNDTKEDLVFTTETEEDFMTGWIPTLDSKCRMETSMKGSPNKNPTAPTYPSQNSPPNLGGTPSSWDKGWMREWKYPQKPAGSHQQTPIGLLMSRMADVIRRDK